MRDPVLEKQDQEKIIRHDQSVIPSQKRIF